MKFSIRKCKIRNVAALNVAQSDLYNSYNSYIIEHSYLIYAVLTKRNPGSPVSSTTAVIYFSSIYFQIFCYIFYTKKTF